MEAFVLPSPGYSTTLAQTNGIQSLTGQLYRASFQTSRLGVQLSLKLLHAIFALHWDRSGMQTTASYTLVGSISSSAMTDTRGQIIFGMFCWLKHTRTRSFPRPKQPVRPRSLSHLASHSSSASQRSKFPFAALQPNFFKLSGSFFQLQVIIKKDWGTPPYYSCTPGQTLSPLLQMVPGLLTFLSLLLFPSLLLTLQ